MIRVLQYLLLLVTAAHGAEPAFQELRGHDRWVLALATSPDGKQLVSGSDDQTLRAWDLKNLGTSRVIRRFGSAVTAIAFGKDSSQVAVGTWDGQLLLCDTRSGKTLCEFNEHRETITALEFDPSGDYLASGSADDRLIVWDIKTGEDLLTMHQGNEYDVSAIAFSPDGEKIVSGDGENQIKVWDAATGEEIETLEGHGEPVTCLGFDHKGRLISGSWDDTVRLWHESGNLTLSGHEGDITALAVHDETIVSASEDKMLKVWNADTGKLEQTLHGHADTIRCLAISPDGKHIFSGSKKAILSWNFEKAPASGEVFSITVELEIPKKTKDKRAGDAAHAPFSIFVPAGIKTIRGVVMNPFHEGTVEQKHWRTAAAHWDFAVVGANLFGVRKEDLGAVTLDGLRALALASGRPEIEHAPLCLVGMSAGGGMCANITAAIPDRVIAAAPVCLEVGPTNEAARAVPMLTIFGERDGSQMEKLDVKLPEARRAGARWGIAVQWGRKHEFHRANNLVMPFFDAAIRTRYPADKTPATDPVELRPTPADSAWLGVKTEWGERPATIRAAANSGLDPATTCWFPDAYTAHVWQAFVTKKPQLRILDPPGLGDGQKLIIHTAGEKLEVKIAVSEGIALERIAIQIGDRIATEADGSVREFAVKNLPVGIHSVIAVGAGLSGKRLLSEPHTILVRH
jgi:WD40 repeat protein/dienelactone hydrolase